MRRKGIKAGQHQDRDDRMILRLIHIACVMISSLDWAQGRTRGNRHVVLGTGRTSAKGDVSVTDRMREIRKGFFEGDATAVVIHAARGDVGNLFAVVVSDAKRSRPSRS